MKWSAQAEEAVSRVPFFVRKRARKKVEEEAARQKAAEVTLEHVKTCQKRFMGNMESEVKGYQVETCFGSGGCPNRAVADDSMAKRIEEMLSGKNLKAFLKERVKGQLKLHHEFRISVSDCPNGCSRPQIVDIGLLGAGKPAVKEESCTQCGACVEVCIEDAVSLPDEARAAQIDSTRCLSCAKCIKACPSEAITETARGYRILVGGKLGRHPQLGIQIGDIYSPDEAIEMIERCIDHYIKYNRAGERFGEIINRTGIEELEKKPS